MNGKQKLELTWIGKEKRPKLEPRILVENPEKSYHAKQRVSDNDLFDNRLIFGDNLLALKALEQEFTGKVKCVYIDPPYNTGSAFEYYDDGLEHSIWLGLMRDRLEIIRRLLAEDGLLFVQIDDNELAYLVVLMDEIFGRENHVNTICVKMSESTGVKMTHASKRFPKLKEYVLLYRKNIMPDLKPVKIPLDKWNDEYKEILLGVDKNLLEEIKLLMDCECSSLADVAHAKNILKNVKVKSLASYFREENISNCKDQEAFKWGNAWRIVQAVGAGSIKNKAIELKVLDKKQDVSALLSARKKLYLYKTGFDEKSNDPRIRIIFADKYLEYNPGDFWTDIKTTGGVGNEGGIDFPNGKKPEALIRRILETCTNMGDLVLDSFAGSGTTGAVAHKMGRRWIMIELGEHCHTHVIPRLKKVIDGEDKGGITQATNWQGGGGFRYYSLAPSLIVNDRWGNAVINPEYNAAQLAEALCKLEGFSYAPSESQWWRHGHSSERDFIYVTTQNLSAEQLQALSDEVGSDQSLLVCCAAFYGITAAKAAERWPNLTLKKIPKMVLSRCEWGHDDYSLNVANLPMAQIEKLEPVVASTTKTSKNKKAASGQGGLFGENE